MPKDASKELDEELLDLATARRPTRKASTLSEMWTKMPSTSTKTKSEKSKGENSNVEDANDEDAPSGSTKSTQKLSVVEAALDTLEDDSMGVTWLEVLKSEFKKSYFIQLKKFLLVEIASYTIYPTIENIYSWSRLTPLEQVKVVILGQDPYHDEGQAHGLSFSVLPPTKPPASLKNIYKQLETDFPGFKSPKSGDLSPVAKQGVLWLNTSLTVRAHKAGSHARKGWETFTTQVIRAVLQREEKLGVVFMAWGLPAQKTYSSLGINEKKHLVLKSPHPSPLSAHKGFLGNGHFRKANEWLVENYGENAGIDWTVLTLKN